MTLFAIRDDDTSAWTEPGQLESCYGEVWRRGIPVSLSVIPRSVESFHPGDRDRFYQTEVTKPLEENRELIDFLQTRIQAGDVNVMLHGFDHLYTVGKDEHSPAKPATKEWLDQLRSETPVSDLVWRGEYAWKDAARLAKETSSGKTSLETALDCKVQVFVPPSNQIGIDGVRAVEAAGLDVSGLIGRGFDRPRSFPYVGSYLKRWAFRVLRGRPYPWVLDLGRHKELVAYSLTPSSSFEGLRDTLAFCFKKGAPFVVATHHWEMVEHPVLRDQLLALCDEAARLGYRAGTVAEYFSR